MRDWYSVGSADAAATFKLSATLEELEAAAGRINPTFVNVPETWEPGRQPQGVNGTADQLSMAHGAMYSGRDTDKGTRRVVRKANAHFKDWTGLPQSAGDVPGNWKAMVEAQKANGGKIMIARSRRYPDIASILRSRNMISQSSFRDPNARRFVNAGIVLHEGKERALALRGGPAVDTATGSHMGTDVVAGIDNNAAAKATGPGADQYRKAVRRLRSATGERRIWETGLNRVYGRPAAPGTDRPAGWSYSMANTPLTKAMRKDMARKVRAGTLDLGQQKQIENMESMARMVGGRPPGEKAPDFSPAAFAKAKVVKLPKM